MNIAIYSRKSCTSDTGESIQNQINICKNYILSHIDNFKNSSIIVYKDEGFSAKNTDRPAFKQMLEDAANKTISHIVCYKLDRISRNVSDFSKLIEKFNKANISFICVKEQFDTSVPMGRAMMYIASVFAQLERETIAERVRDNMLMLAKNGQWLGGTTPLGMRPYKVYNKGSSENSKYKFYLKTDENEIEIVKKIYSKFLECNKSLTKTKQYLDLINIKTKNDKNFSIPTIKKILSNPIYCSADSDAINYFKKLGADINFGFHESNKFTGIIAYNKRNYHKSSGTKNPIKDWVIALGKHSGAIPGKKWIEIHSFFNSGFKKATFKNKVFLLSGKIFCKICGSKMLIKSNNYNKNFNYICAKKIYNSSKKCSCSSLNGKYVDKLVISEIILGGIKNNPFFIKKLKSLKSNSSISTLQNNESTKTNNLNAYKILENIDKKSQIHFLSKTTDRVFWDNTCLSIKLKNHNY